MTPFRSWGEVQREVCDEEDLDAIRERAQRLATLVRSEFRLDDDGPT